MSLKRQLSYFWQRYVIRPRTLMADGLPLGLRMAVHAPDDVGRRLFKYQVHEPHLLEWLESQPVPVQGALALDVGANIGWYSLVLARLSPEALDIHAFEPDPENHELLQHNLELNGATNVTASTLALSSEKGSSKLFRYREINRGKHSLEPLEGAVDEVLVSTISLDDYLEAMGSGDCPIWLLKLDVEGHEPAVIAGARNSLCRVQGMMLEYTPALYAREAAREMLESLWQAGLRPSLWSEERWSPCSLDDLLALEQQHDTVWSRKAL